MKPFHNAALQAKLALAEKASQEQLKRLDAMSLDIKHLEKFLQGSGFGYFTRLYLDPEDNDIFLTWDGYRLCLNDETPLIEKKVKYRLSAYPFLADFLERISLHHMNMGEKK